MQDSFKDLLIESLGAEAASTALDALEEAPAVSVRYNQAKYQAPEGEAVAWNADGRFLAERPVFTLDPLLQRRDGVSHLNLADFMADRGELLAP